MHQRESVFYKTPMYLCMACYCDIAQCWCSQCIYIRRVIVILLSADVLHVSIYGVLLWYCSVLMFSMYLYTACYCDIAQCWCSRCIYIRRVIVIFLSADVLDVSIYDVLLWYSSVLMFSMYLYTACYCDIAQCWCSRCIYIWRVIVIFLSADVLDVSIYDVLLWYSSVLMFSMYLYMTCYCDIAQCWCSQCIYIWRVIVIFLSADVLNVSMYGVLSWYCSVLMFSMYLYTACYCDIAQCRCSQCIYIWRVIVILLSADVLDVSMYGVLLWYCSVLMFSMYLCMACYRDIPQCWCSRCIYIWRVIVILLSADVLNVSMYGVLLWYSSVLMFSMYLCMACYCDIAQCWCSQCIYIWRVIVILLSADVLDVSMYGVLLWYCSVLMFSMYLCMACYRDIPQCWCSRCIWRVIVIFLSADVLNVSIYGMLLWYSSVLMFSMYLYMACYCDIPQCWCSQCIYIWHVIVIFLSADVLNVSMYGVLLWYCSVLMFSMYLYMACYCDIAQCWCSVSSQTHDGTCFRTPQMNTPVARVWDKPFALPLFLW